MAFRGRGRGRGFGGGGFRFAKQEPFVLFPDIELPDKSNVQIDEGLVKLKLNFRKHFKNSPYFLNETFSDKEETVDIEKYSDKGNRKSRFSRESLSSSGYLILEPGYFPLELVRGVKCKIGRKVQWNPKQDLRKLDFLEELEEKLKNQEPKSKKEKEGEEDEEEEDLEEEEEEEEDYSDDDYCQNQDFDDDEDDYNMADDGDDEAIL